MNYEISLSAEVYQLKESIRLELESVNGEWRFKPNQNYTIVREQGDAYGFLQMNDVLALTTFRDEHVTMVVSRTEAVFPVLPKYDISRLSQVTIGSAAGSDICYNFLNMVAPNHVLLRKDGAGWNVQPINGSCVFLNARKLTAQSMLRIGDCIDVFGLKILFLDGRIAITSVKQGLQLGRNILPLHYVESFNGKKKTPPVRKREKEYFHRSPRNVAPLETDQVQIEAPPAPKEINRRPLFMVIGPSFTMMIPMMMGSLLAMYSSRSRGGGSAFMYTGIITAVGSAVFGVFWALVNLRYEKKKITEGEQKRFEAYSDYLIKRAAEIKDKYEQTRRNLLEQYPEVNVCAQYNRNTPALWSRNRGHEDFLMHRLGIGNLPFQVPIDVPKEKFTLTIDQLAEKPALIKKEYETLYDVPVRIDLTKKRIIGLVGGRGKEGARSIMRTLAAQIAANNTYTDVKMAFVYDGQEDEGEWNFARWLPHVWAEDKKARYVASNREEASDVLYELVKIFRMRCEEGNNRKKELPKPYYILFVSDTSMLEGELINKYIYDMDENVGLTTIIMTESYEQLPNLCQYVIEKDDQFEGYYDLSESERHPVKFDEIAPSALERLARTLTGIEVKEVEKGGDIPNALTFFEMFHVNRPDELNAIDRWRKNRNYENMRAEVGVKAGGDICYLDVHEKYHGPHGLVAGTTGSGKSETLQTYMLSLALNFSPDDINFFIIDYKGGGMANLFDGLPHLIGQISNLSGNQINRAMVSIKSENKRRQRVFNENNVNNINLYTKLYKNGEATLPVPHLFIIIDEFAELKREEPEFMKQLISVAQVGRSLGVHLILATQKPSGTVDDNIWSNSKFRLCLRVQDRQDSNDMLHKPDAAYITQAGRCYLQVGNDELYELFQSGYSGATYDENAGSWQSNIASMVSLTGKAALIGGNLKRKKQSELRFTWIYNLIQIMQQSAADRNMSMEDFADDPDHLKQVYKRLQYFDVDYPESDYNSRRLEELLLSYNAMARLMNAEQECPLEKIVEELLKYVDENNVKLPEQKLKTQLDAMVEYLAKVARENGYNHKFQLWMPLLPISIPLTSLSGYKEHIFDGTKWPAPPEMWTIETPLGLCDDPVSQAQMPLVVNFSENGHHAILGMIVSGKSTLLQTMIFALIHRYAPDYLNIYAIDFSSRMLSAFEHAPHVGGVMYEDDTEKIDKFFHMMDEELEKRKQLFKGGNYSQYVRANGVKLPAVIIAVDNYGSFREKTENKYDEAMIHLSHDGVSYGIFLVMTAGGFGSSEIQTKVGDNIKTTIALQMNDKFQYADAMRVTRIETLPESDIAGRGLARVGERILEYQTAIALEADDDYKRMEQIHVVCKSMQHAWTGKRAKQVPVIPEKPIWSEFEELPDAESMYQEPKLLPIGYDLESAAVYGADLSKTYCYIISGRSRTGKTNALKALIRSASHKRGRVVVIEHSGDELESTAAKVGARYITSQAEQAEFFKDLLEPIKKRNVIKKELIAAGEEDLIFEKMQEEEPVFVFISNMETFITSIYKPEEGIMNIAAFLENITEKGKGLNIYFFAALNPDQTSSLLGRRVYENMVGYHAGMHFGGVVTSVRYMDFSYMGYTEQGKTQKMGIALLPTGNEDTVTRVVVPLVKG